MSFYITNLFASVEEMQNLLDLARTCFIETN